ncbi:MAG: hypothetical protein C0610_09495 [Desulfobacteraceae bacterium]|nr:MAG: hypothetical protein C0610_09495 [Desulfobacteraceae bacterium]
MTDSTYRRDYLTGDKKCIFCGAGAGNVRLLNTKGEIKGGVEGFYYRCVACKQYFVEYWINGELKTVLAS